MALRHPGPAFPFETPLTVDTSPGSPWVNGLYVSGVMVLGPGHGKNQFQSRTPPTVGATWTQAAVDPVQQYPEENNFTRMAVGKDGTVYITWLHCRGKNGSGAIAPPSISCSRNQQTGVTRGPRHSALRPLRCHFWLLPITKERVYNYPAIVVDDSDGPYSGNLYVGDVQLDWNLSSGASDPLD